jgi:hypothetical protein
MIPDQITLRDLGDGLRLRCATFADIENLIALNAEILAPTKGARVERIVQGGSPYEPP